MIAYALSPLDLIPDFIPVLGLLDDLILLPALIWLALKLIPKQARGRETAVLLIMMIILLAECQSALLVLRV